MFTSLRARLLVWYSLLLVALVIAFAGLVLFAAWRARLADIDAQLDERAEALTAGLRPSESGTFDFTLPTDIRAAFARASSREYYAVWDGHDHLIDQVDVDDTRMPPQPGIVTTAQGREHMLRTPDGAAVLVGRRLDDVWTELWELSGTMSAIATGALIVVLTGGWWLVGRALGPVRHISQTANAMIGGDLTARIPLDRVETEVELLARAINEAFDRLYKSLQRQQQFAADASHELRTPLATLTTEAHWALSHERTTDEYRASLDVCQRAAARMQQTVEQLLQLARADAGDVATAQSPCRVDTIAVDVVESLRPLAATRKIQLAVNAEPQTVAGDADRLREALDNLVANAIHYNVQGGQVIVTVRADAEAAAIEVRDTGIGISAEHLPRIFDRFYRADASRTVGAGGAGLGLAVARAIIERHGGRMTCESTLGVGTTFTVQLPQLPWTQAN